MVRGEQEFALHVKAQCMQERVVGSRGTYMFFLFISFTSKSCVGGKVACG